MGVYGVKSSGGLPVDCLGLDQDINTQWLCVPLMVAKSLLFISWKSFTHLWLLFLQQLSLVSVKGTLSVC